jgi:hypothetical protein
LKLPYNQLVLEHPGVAFALKVMEAMPEQGYKRARFAIADTALATPALADKAKSLGKKFQNAQWIGKNSHQVFDMTEGVRKGVEELDGFYILKDPKWGNILIDEDMAEMVHNLKTTVLKQDPLRNLLPRFTGWFDRTMGFLKRMVLNIPPGSFGTIMRNGIDDFTKMFVATGAGPIADGASDMMAMMGNKSLRYTFADTAVDLNKSALAARLARDGRLSGYTRAETYLTDVPQFRQARHAPGIAQIAWVERTMGHANEWFDNERRLLYFSGLLRKYKDLPIEQAMMKASKSVSDVLFEYPLLTAFEQTFAARAVFFYRYLRWSVPFWLKMPFERPFWMMVALKMPELMLGEEMTEEEKAYMPEWIRWRGGYLARRKGKQAVFGAGLGLSVYDVYSKLWPGRWWEEGLGALNPIIRIPLERLSGKYFFMDTKLVDRNQIYSPAFAKALSTLNPAWKELKGVDFVNELTRSDGTHYWVVPAPVVYLINQIRPVNDLMKALDPRFYGQGWMTEAQWIATGMREYPVDIESEKLRKQRDYYREQLDEMSAQGLVRFGEIPYIIKGLEESSETKATVDELIAKFRTVQKLQRAQSARKAG